MGFFQKMKSCTKKIRTNQRFKNEITQKTKNAPQDSEKKIIQNKILSPRKSSLFPHHHIASKSEKFNQNRKNNRSDKCEKRHFSKPCKY